MSIGYIILGCICVVAFVFIMLNKKSGGFRAVVTHLENETNALQVRVTNLEEERNILQTRVAEMRGIIEAEKEAQEAKNRALAEAALESHARTNETFMTFLLRKGIVSKEMVERVKAYKVKNSSNSPLEELLVMFDHISSKDMQAAQLEYNQNKCGAKECP